MVELNNTHIKLREFRKEDWHAVHEYASEAIVSRFQPWGPNSKAESQQFVNDILVSRKQNPRTRYAFAVIDKQTDNLIGAVELYSVDPAHRKAELGYVIHHEHWGKGYATEVAKLLLDFGFSNLNLHRISATCNPENSSSVKVLEKLGMKSEGKLRDDLWIKDRWRDSSVYSVLANEWNPASD